MIKEIKGEDFRKMQLTELDMLVEFDKVCRKYNINYVLFGGSLLGAVRHQGYIPWDDDADIGMLREDYETFKKHKDEMNPNICFFQDHDTDPEYRWEYGKLRRTGSTYIRVGHEHLKCKTGIFVDVFPMDDIPLSIVGQIFQNLHCYCLRRFSVDCSMDRRAIFICSYASFTPFQAFFIRITSNSLWSANWISVFFT